MILISSRRDFKGNLEAEVSFIHVTAACYGSCLLRNIVLLDYGLQAADIVFKKTSHGGNR